MKRKTIDEIAEEAVRWATRTETSVGSMNRRAARRAIQLWSRQQRRKRG